jgi:hypothetical protein
MTERYIAAMAAEFKNMRDEAGRMPLDAETANFDIQFGRLDGIRQSIEAFIRVAKQDNPRFDAYRFRAWCGLEG